VRNLDIIVLDTPRAEAIEILSSSCDLLIFPPRLVLIVTKARGSRLGGGVIE
jgi:hypothetical protein